MTRLLVSLCFSVALAACNGNQNVTGRFSSATCRDESQTVATDCSNQLPEIMVTAVLTSKAPDKAAENNATSLPERALTRYIEAMQHFSKDAATLRRNLAEPLTGSSAPPPAFIDSSNFPGTIYLTAAYSGPFNPVDRIERLQMTMTLTNGEFVSWTGARTLYTDIKSGSIESVGKASLSGSLDIKPPAPVPVSGGITASTDRTRTERLDLIQHVEDLTVSVEPTDKLVMSRRGGLGVDLTGNAQIDVVLSTNDDKSSSPTLFRVTGYGSASAPTNPAELTITPVDTRIARVGVGATIQAEYVVRHVVSGGETGQDADDVVSFITRRMPPRRVVLTRPTATTWGLSSRTKIFGRSLRFFAVRDGQAKPILLCFATKSEATDLLNYLHRLPREPTVLGPMQLGLENMSRLEQGFGGLDVNPGCAPG